MAAQLLVLAGAGLLGACASLPTGPEVHQVNATQSSGGPGVEGARSVPVPPGPDWLPNQVVAGFLSASADDIKIAKQYLAPSYRAQWNPSLWKATVVDQSPALSMVPQPKQAVTQGGTSPETATVILTTTHLATLTSGGPFEAGQYQASAVTRPFQFDLTRLAGGWRITHLDSPNLILTEPDFVRDYQPRNLYFFAGLSSQILVPEPVFVPEQAGVNLYDRATGLVNALFKPPAGWLDGAVSTAFPPGTKLNGDIQVIGGDATVDLGGTAARSSASQRRRMAAQLVWTLNNSSYMAAPDIRSVMLKFNGQPWQGGAQLLAMASEFTRQVPQISNGPLYYLAAGGGQGQAAAETSLRTLSQSGVPATIALPQSLSKVSFSVVAVSPGGGEPAMFAGCAGDSLYYVTALGRPADVQSFPLAGPCSALSWDPGGNLWVAMGHTIAMIPPDGILMPVGEPYDLAGKTVVALRVAPDGVRMALIVSTPSGASEVLIAAISDNQVTSLGPHVAVGSDLVNPIALSWYDADHLVVLDQPTAASVQMYLVPLDGLASTQLSTPSGSVSVSASAWGTALVNQQQITIIPRSNGPWVQIGPGAAAVFPG